MKHSLVGRFARGAMHVRNVHLSSLAIGLITVCLSLSACQRHEQSPAGKVTTAAVAASVANEGEKRARAAGADLIGTPAPSIRLTTVDGERIDLTKFYGKRPVYLKFWATWCIPCRQQMPKFERIFETEGSKIAVIAVDTGFNDDEVHVRAFRKQYGLKMPIAIDDGRLAQALHLQVTPQHVVIGRDGRIAYIGNLDGADLDTALAKTLSAPPNVTPPAVTRGLASRRINVSDTIGRLAAIGVDGSPQPLMHIGHPRAILFFSTWCESYLEKSRPESSRACRVARLAANRLVKEVHTVEWLGVAGGPWSTEPKDLTDYANEVAPKFPVSLDTDGSLFRAFGVRQIPSVALIGPDGRLIKVLGPNEDIDGAVRQAGRVAQTLR